MCHLWISRAAALSIVQVLTFIALPLRCLGAIEYEQTCYFPDQSVANGYAPCNISASGTQGSASACCSNNGYSYCTTSGLCYENGLLSRGGCTDRTWASASCAPFCNNTVIHNPVNLFSCHKPSIFQCGTGNGPGDCSANFTLPIQNIILRADQEPGAQNAVNFSDPSATFVNKDALNSTNTAPPNLNTTAIASGDTGPSVTAVGLGIGLPLGFLLLVSLGIIIWQERRIQHSKKYPTKVNQVDLMRAAQAANSSRDQIARPGPYTWRGGEMPTNLQGSVDRNLSLQIPQQSGSLNGSRNDDAHELYSPVRTEPRSGV